MSVDRRSRLNRVTGAPESHALDRRVLNATTFSATIVLGLLFVSDLLVVGQLRIYAITLAACLYFLLLHALGRRRLEIAGLAWAFLLGSQLLIAWLWWTTGTVVGAVLLSALALGALAPVLLPPKQGVAAAGGIGLQILGMVAFQLLRPGFGAALSGRSLLLDEAATTLMLGAGVVLLQTLLVLSLRRERERVEAFGRELAAANGRLQARNAELAEAQGTIRSLEGIVPICSACKKVRNDKGYYEAVEAYVSRHSGARFSHTLCPDCLPKYFPEDDGA